MEPAEGFEPPTHALQMRSSTAELSRLTETQPLSETLRKGSLDCLRILATLVNCYEIKRFRANAVRNLQNAFGSRVCPKMYRLKCH